MKIAITIMWAVYALLVTAAIANAHDWYESACCSGKDCAPVPEGSVVETHDGIVVKGWGILSESDGRIRWSQDDRDHICARPANQWGPAKLLCVYRKRKFM